MQSLHTYAEIAILIMALIWIPIKKLPWFILALMLLLLSSCSKRIVDLEKSSTTHSLKQYSDTSAKIKVDTRIRMKGLTRIETKSRYQVTIIPEGDIQYQPGTGFKGKAKSITITGEQDVLQDMSSELQLDRDSSANTAASTSSNETSSSSRKGKHSTAQRFSWSLGWLIIPVLGILCFIFRNPLKKMWSCVRSSLKF